MKNLLTLALLFSSLYGFSQNKIRLDYKNNRVGYTVWDDNSKVIYQIEPAYDYLAVYAEFGFAGIFLGEMYYDIKMCCDTEFIEVPIDPDDPTRTRVDTIITDQRKVVPHKLMMAKKNQVWGLLNLDGTEAMPFVYDSISILQNQHASENGPLFVLYKNKRIAIANQKRETVLSSELYQQYYPKLSPKEQVALLNIALFNDQLIVQQGGKFIDTTIFVKATTSYVKIKGVKQKQKVYQAAFRYDEFFFRGGKYNVLNLKQNTLLFGVWQNKISLRMTSKTALETPLIMDLTKRKSVMEASGRYLSVKEKIEVQYMPDPFINSK